MKRLRHLRGEAGASSVELLVFFPLLLLIILLAVQTGLSWYGNEVAIQEHLNRQLDDLRHLKSIEAEARY